MKPFQFIAILHPTGEARKTGAASEVIVEITTVLAKDESGAAMLAGRALPETALESLARVEVIVRPF